MNNQDYMKRYAFIAAVAALSAGTAAYAQQPAGAPEGGISPEMLAEISKGYEGDADELMMIALDAGAEDLVEEEDSFEILTDPNDFSEVRQALEEAGIPMVNAEVTMIPQTYVTLTSAEDLKNINKTLDLLDDDDDVQNVYHNWDE